MKFWFIIARDSLEFYIRTTATTNEERATWESIIQYIKVQQMKTIGSCNPHK